MAKMRHHYLVEIQIPGQTYWFGTLAVSESKAIGNGVAQYAKKINMSIAGLRSYIKKNGIKCLAELKEEEHEAKLTNKANAAEAK